MCEGQDVGQSVAEAELLVGDLFVSEVFAEFWSLRPQPAEPDGELCLRCLFARCGWGEFHRDMSVLCDAE